VGFPADHVVSDALGRSELDLRSWSAHGADARRHRLGRGLEATAPLQGASDGGFEHRVGFGEVVHHAQQIAQPLRYLGGLELAALVEQPGDQVGRGVAEERDVAELREQVLRLVELPVVELLLDREQPRVIQRPLPHDPTILPRGQRHDQVTGSAQRGLAQRKPMAGFRVSGGRE
jgi:hypothetical protein